MFTQLLHNPQLYLESPYLIFRLRQQRLEGGHERLHHVGACVTRRIEDVCVIENDATPFGVTVRKNKYVAEINLERNCVDKILLSKNLAFLGSLEDNF